MIATRYEDEINVSFLPSENLWLAVEPLLPDMKRQAGGRGRPAKSSRQMFLPFSICCAREDTESRCPARLAVPLRFTTAFSSGGKPACSGICGKAG